MVNHQLSLLYSYYSFRSLVPFRFLIVYLALIMVLRLPAFLEKLIAGLKEREAGMRCYTDFTLRLFRLVSTKIIQLPLTKTSVRLRVRAEIVERMQRKVKKKVK